MKKKILLLFAACIMPAGVYAAPQIEKTSSREAVRKMLAGGVPGGHWKEGLMFEGVLNLSAETDISKLDNKILETGYV